MADVGRRGGGGGAAAMRPTRPSNRPPPRRAPSPRTPGRRSQPTGFTNGDAGAGGGAGVASAGRVGAKSRPSRGRKVRSMPSIGDPAGGGGGPTGTGRPPSTPSRGSLHGSVSRAGPEGDATGGGLHGGPSQRMGDSTTLHRIEELQEQCEYYTKRIEVERRRSEELDKKLKISTSKLEKVRLDMGRLESRDELAVAKRQLSNLEHRLDKMSVRLNQALNHNKQLKSHIEDLRREKMQREAIKNKLEREVNDSKKEMIRVIQEAQQAADARDKAERQAVVLEATIKSEVAEFEEAFQRRMGELEAERHKSTKRRGPESPGSVSVGSDEGERPGSPFKGEMTIEQEKELKHKSTKAIWEVVKREIDLRKQDEQLRGFEEAFATIKMHTGIETIDAMVQEFCDAEDQNFSLITIINGLNKEVEQVEVQNAEMEAKLEAARGQGSETETHRNKIFGALEEQIRAAEKKSRWYNHKHDEALKALASVKGGLLGLFQKVGCKDESTAENVAATGITDGNVMEVLGIIEQRIAEIVQMNELSLGKAVRRSHRPMAARNERGHAAALPSTLEPSDDDDDDDDGPASRPLSLAELKARTATQLSRKIAHGTVQLPSTSGRVMVTPP